MQGLVSYEHLRELQRFAELGRMSASLLHEIRTPLTAAMINLELSGQQTAGVQRAQSNMRLLRRYVEAARQQVRLESRTTRFLVRRQLEELKHVVVPLAMKAGVSLDFGPVPNCALNGDPVKFQHIVTNLAVNAIEAYGDRRYGRRRVRLEFKCRDKWLVVKITDWGKGIPAEALPHVFQAFYTTKGRSGHGLGIGLAIVKQCVANDFAGSIKVTSSRRRGTCFTIKLPRHVE